jgi:hypothetical protein
VAPGQFRLPGQHHWRCRQTHWRLVFCSPSRLFHHDAKLTTLTRTWYRKTNYRDPKLIATYRDWQKTRHRDADANSLNRRAVSVHFETLTGLDGDHFVENYIGETNSFHLDKLP